MSCLLVLIPRVASYEAEQGEAAQRAWKGDDGGSQKSRDNASELVVKLLLEYSEVVCPTIHIDNPPLL